MNRLLAVVLLASSFAACRSDSPPGAVVTNDVPLPDSPLARLKDVSLIRAGDGFVLAGYDAGVVHWGRLSLDGALLGQASFALAQPVVGPVFAVTRKTSPADQLVALAVVPSTSVTQGYDLVATVHTFGAPTPAAPLVLSAPDWFPTGTDPSTIALIAGAAASGNVGYVAWGIRAFNLPIRYLLLPADALTTATPTTFLDVPEWDCLAPQSRPTGLSFGAVTPTSVGSDFQTLDIDETGATSGMTYPLEASVLNCHIVGAPAAGGSYYIALQGLKEGTSAVDFATFYPRPDGGGGGDVKTRHPVLPAAKYGSPMDLPYPAWVTSAGGDVVIGLVRASGPEIVRFTYYNVPHGSTLTLRSANGRSGPVAAWVGDDAVYVTYADEVKSSGTTSVKRYFMTIVSPAALP